MKKLFILPVLLGMLCLHGCGNADSSQRRQTNPYITACTGGAVSIEAAIQVRLAQSYDDTLVDNTALQKLFRISPAVEGEVYRVDAATLAFKPAKRLKPGTEYTVKFAVSQLFPEAAGNDKTFTFSFVTLKPFFTREIDGLKLYDDEQPGRYYLEGAVQVADYVDEEKVARFLQAEVAGKPVAVKWQHNNRTHGFTVENLETRDEAYPVVLKWTGKSVDYDYAATDTVMVPEKNAFKLLSVRIDADGNKIVCVFSLPLDARQKYASYVQLAGVSNLRFSTTSNRLEITLPFKPNAPTTLTLREGLKAKGGITLAEDCTAAILFEELKPALQLLSKGVVMPNSNGLTLPFQAVNLKAVDVWIYKTYENNVLQFLQINNLDGERELRRVARPVARKTIRLDENKSLNLHFWNTFSIDLAKVIAPEPGALYTVKIKFNKTYSLYSQCPGNAQSDDLNESYMTENLPDELPDDTQHDDDYYYDYDYDYDYNYGYCSDNPCSDSYYCERRFVSQNILASDIGLVAKRGSDNNYLVFVTNLVTAEPMSGVRVILYNYQQQKMTEVTSDANGVAQLTFKETPFLLVAQQGAQKSYLRIGDNLSLSLSTFDVSGAAVNNGLKGYIYGERGVWRPGDTLFLTFVLEDRTGQLPKNHPITFELYNVQNQLVEKQVRTEGHHGFYTFICPTSVDAPTGNWEAYVKVGGVTFSKTLRVATIKPNRLKIATTLDSEPVTGDYLAGDIKAQWLHGAKTSGNEADVTVHLTAMRTTFKNYDDYSFDDITKHFTGEEEKSHKGRLNENGTMRFNIPIATHNEAPGKLRAAVAIRVFEEGGEFSTDHFTAEVSPYTSYAGLKMPEGIGYYNRLETGKDQRFDVVSLDASGKPVTRKLQVQIFRNEWYWWWFSTDGNLANYTHRLYENELFATTVETTNGVGSFTYKLDYPEWGLLLIKVTDPESGHSVTQKAYIDWWGYGRGNDDSNSSAAILSFHTDKDKYNVGDKAVVTIPSTDGAKAIVTVENGSRVLASFRVDCKGTETQVTIPTTAEMTPNAYIFVTLLQPHQQTGNDLPMRLYGVVPLMVEDPATRITPEISMPNVIRPEQPFKIKVKEAGNKDMTYTIAIVDEGLLDLTRFKTPDLWNHFYQREALGVRTWDIYNFVLGAYGGKIEQLFAIGGGDDAGNNAGNEKANRFKPVVKFAGPFTANAGKTNEHTFILSNYVGSVRTMVIAGNGKAYGKAEKTIPVRSPLMVQATLPRVLGPGEEVVLPAAIFAMEKQVKNVKVEIKTSDLLESIGGTIRTISFTDVGDQLVKFTLRVKNKLGVARVKVVATSGNERAEHEIEIAIRASNPAIVATSNKIIQGNQSITLALQAPGMVGTNEAQLEASSIPPLNLGTRLNYLLAYPHGCLEQTTSAVFPQLFLPDVADMSTKDKERAAANIKAAIAKYAYFVRPDGAFSYWPGGGYKNEWTNIYAGYFLIEAERKGYAIPGAMKENWIACQQKAARNWSRSNVSDRRQYEEDDLLQSFCLYVLALAKKPELSAMNRLKESTSLSMQSKWMLAGAYALVGQKEAAKSIINNLAVPANITYSDGFAYTYGSVSRDEAMMLDVLTLVDSKDKAFLMAKRISDAVNTSEWMSTQTTAWCLLSLSKYAMNEKGSIGFSYVLNNGKSQHVSVSKSVWNTTLGAVDGTTAVKIDNKGDNTLFVRLTVKGIPPGGEEQAAEHDLKIAVRYVDAGGRTIDILRLPQGTDFEAEVKITHPAQRSSYTNMALTHLFPSGWEITENRLENATRTDGITYRDIRDDRMYTYFDLKQGQTLTLRVKLRAAYVGKFYLPAIACEAMYDAGIHANTRGQQVEVY